MKKTGKLVQTEYPSNDIAIKVENVSKSFRLPHNRQSSIKGTLVNLIGGGDRTYETQRVLKNISVEIKKGEFFGIVGRNGSGKSTLLKMLAGIYTPTKGTITVNGSLTPFIELGVGFNPELTGRENVYLNGSLLGFNRSEMDDMYEDIVEFAELERFMDQKLKNYSSGMQVRLAFSIAIRAQSDILVLDEVLAVGDEAFQRKCYAYFAELKRNNKTVILVTHSMDSVQQFCTRALLINDGKIIECGNPAKVAGAYQELNNIGVISRDRVKSKDDEAEEVAKKYISAAVSMEKTSEKLLFDISINAKTQINDAVIALFINRDTGESVYRWASDDDAKKSINLEKDQTIKVHLEIDNIFPDGEYDMQLVIKKADRSQVYALINRITDFRLINPNIKKRNQHWKPKESYNYE